VTVAVAPLAFSGGWGETGGQEEAMRRSTIRAGRALAALLLLAALAPVAPSASRAQEQPKAKCCFTNPRYAGTCEVTPAKDESCGQILGYLNNPMSQGKSYCGGTAIRGGWQQVSCEAKQ